MRLLVLVACSLICGCTHFSETRAITAFTEAMVAGDMEELRATTSRGFEQKALRRTEALDDLQVLRLPEEPPEIVEVEDISDIEKHVTVKSPNGDSKLLYKLTRGADSKGWVVDDVFTRQMKSGVQVSKPITEQMDLLLTIRDFLEVWDKDDREAVLAITTPEFRGPLSELPAPWLARLTQQVVGNSQRNKSERHHKPQVSIDDKTATVRMPRTDGTLQLSLKLSDAGWKVDDASIQTRRDEDQIRSVRNRALVVAAGTRFVEAFRNQSRDQLKAVATTDFYEDVLQDADLADADVPDITLAPKDYELSATVDHATLLVPTPESVVKIELRRLTEEISDGKVEYRVRDVALYEKGGQTQVRLTAFFTASRQVEQFHRALRRSNVTELTSLTTTDFSDRVWQRADGLPLQLLPLATAGGRLLETTSTSFNGSVTRVTARHKGGDATYVLRDADGRLLVDDIVVSVRGSAQSLKQSLELAIPILSFAGAVETKQLTDVQRVCSRDFNRMVWDSVSEVPEVGPATMRYLTQPIRSIRTQPGRALVELGTPGSGAVISLLQEHKSWVVDDIELIAGVKPSQHVQLKQALRQQMASGDNRFTSRMIAAAEGATEETGRPEHKRFNLQQPPTGNSEPDPLRTVAATADASAQVTQAMLFEPAKPDQPAATDFAEQPSVRPPGVLDVAADSQPLPAAVSDPDSVDLEALFRDADLDSPGEPEPNVHPVSPDTLRINDPGRVSDPSLQPIEIPR